MKKYDYQKAKEIIEREKDEGAIEASLYMSGDYFWTAGEVWNKDEGYIKNLDDEELTIGGINGSSWATPMLEVDFGEYTKNFECHDGGDSDWRKKPLWV